MVDEVDVESLADPWGYDLLKGIVVPLASVRDDKPQPRKDPVDVGVHREGRLILCVKRRIMGGCLARWQTLEVRTSHGQSSLRLLASPTGTC
jgi:hypothetical protein